MRTRGLVAAAAGVAGAALAHGLDVAGLLPFVHESAAVRSGLGPLATSAWLTLAGLLAAVAAARGPVAVGVPAAVAVSGLPELAGRHDLGGMLEPPALAGAALQWGLLALVLALLLLVDRHLFRPDVPVRTGGRCSLSPPVLTGLLQARPPVRRHAARAPPRSLVVAVP